MHEEDANLRLGVIWWHQNGAVHIGVAAWLPHQQLAQIVVLFQCGSASLQDVAPRKLRITGDHDAERLTRRVIVEHLNGAAARCGRRAQVQAEWL